MTIQRKLQTALDSFTRTQATALLAKIVQRTPVATGRAQAGWQLSFNENGALITNAVPYIWALEYGSSQQAPLGMVRVTLAEARLNKRVQD